MKKTLKELKERNKQKNCIVKINNI